MSDEENFLEEESFQTNEYEADRQEGECSTGDSEKLIKPYEEMIVETELIVDMEGGCTAEDIKSAFGDYEGKYRVQPYDGECSGG